MRELGSSQQLDEWRPTGERLPVRYPDATYFEDLQRETERLPWEFCVGTQPAPLSDAGELRHRPARPRRLSVSELPRRRRNSPSTPSQLASCR
jgi:hypothetical protein